MITASQLYDYDTCPHRVWRNLCDDRSYRNPRRAVACQTIIDLYIKAVEKETITPEDAAHEVPLVVCDLLPAGRELGPFIHFGHIDTRKKVLDLSNPDKPVARVGCQTVTLEF